MGSRIIIIILILSSFGASADSWLNDYPGRQLVDSAIGNSVESHLIILGSLKKVNNVLEPENFEYVVGTKRSQTFFVPGERDVDQVKDFYRVQLLKLGEILFECSGRNCGSSNYWANTVFAKPILYGPEQFQRYFLVRLKHGEYVSVYVAMRGTRKLYFHIEVIGKDQVREKIERFSFQTSEAALSFAREILSSTEELMLHIVVHHDMEEGRAIEYSIETSKQIGNKIKGLLGHQDRITTHGLGALAENKSRSPSRIELLVIRP